MRTDLEKSQENGWERSSNFVRQQSAEEVMNRRAERDSAKRRTDRNRSSKNGLDRDKKILIIGGVAVLLVIILIFSAGKSWQRRTDKKEIETLSQLNQELKTQVSDLKKSNEELQDTISSLQTEPKSTVDTTGTENGTSHVLQTAYNFREEANVDSDVIGELDEGTTVKILKVMSDNWVQAEYNGQTGYLKCGDELTGSSSQGSNTEGSGNSNEDSNSAEDDGTSNEA